MVWFCFQGLSLFGAQQTNDLPLLTAARQVKQLSPEEAGRAYPVRVRGVVVYYHQATRCDLFIQDSTSGIYISDTAAKGYHLDSGDVVEVEGVSGPGNYSPVVLVSNLTVIGHSPLPEPREVTRERLATGIDDGQLVKVAGIIRSAFVYHGKNNIDVLQVDLMTRGGRLNARVPVFDRGGIDRLIDCEATIVGASTPVFNRRRQLIDVRLSVQSDQQIHVEKTAPPDPYSAPTHSINSLRQFEPEATFGHRTKLAGTVTYQEPGQSLFIRDDTQGLWVKPVQSTPLNLGDRVEVLGFPGSGGYSPVLEDAIYRKIGGGAPPEPLKITVERAQEGNYDGDLVELEGELMDWIPTPSEQVLVVQDKGVVFRAQLPRADQAFPPVPLRSRIRLTGICLVQLVSQRGPLVFHLQLRSPADLVVLSQPGWWTLTRVLWALGAISILFIAALGWVVTLKRRVRIQTEIIQQKVQREAVLEERTRIAREFHDTLEQQLAAITLQMQVIRSRLESSPEFARRVLQVVESMLRHTQSEARHSVWDLRARALEHGDLGSALRTIADYVRNGFPVEVRVKVEGQVRSLPQHVENNLLRIGQEATANAVKHGHARQVRISLRYELDAVELSVEDDGAGFEIESAPSGQSGHFGLLGMRERAEKIGGRFNLGSAPGHGTRVEVTMPLEQEPR